MDFIRNEQAQGLTEYALIISFVVIVGMIALFFFGPAVSDTYAMVVERVSAVVH